MARLRVRVSACRTVAVAVALVILIVGILLRRRRARAFKSTFPLNPQGQTQQHQQPQGYYGQQYHGGPPQPQYGQSYTSQPASSPAVATGGYDQPPPQCESSRLSQRKAPGGGSKEKTPLTPAIGDLPFPP